MNRQEPPLWLQRALLLLLRPRDRETVSGDLLEEYRQEKLPFLGSARANHWYGRQVMSFASIQILGGPVLKQLLISVCCFSIMAGIWLGVMENVLRHDGYRARSVVAACIVVQSLGTLLLILLSGHSVFRITIMLGAAAIILVGGSAFLNNMRSNHFEGFAFLISLALMIQGVLTFITLLHIHRHMQQG
ncbi:MAG: hypothetical protein JO185_20790 [Acidobacteriaceae bacterium]|nr:hypothetical protein [Acidobacteriaceae bacterium]